MIRILTKIIIYEIIVHVILNVIRRVKFSEKILVKYLDIKNCSCKKHLFNKLVIAYADKILNTA